MRSCEENELAVYLFTVSLTTMTTLEYMALNVRMIEL